MTRTILAILLAFTAALSYAAPAYQAQPLSEVAIFPERSASAQVVSLNESKLASQLAARIESINAQAGQIVPKGTLLVKLECNDYDLATERAAAALQASQASAHLAELQLTRSRKLAEQHFISSSGLDTQLAQTESARADVSISLSTLHTAQNNQGKCALYAPFSAVILQRIAHVGEMAAPGTPLLQVRDLSSLEVKANIQEKDSDIKHAETINFITAQGTYPVQIIRVSPALDSTTRLMEVRLRFKQATALSGSHGRIVWRSNKMHLPPQLIVRRNGKLGIFILQADTPHFMPLAHAEEGRVVEVSELDGHTLIVTQGQASL